MITMKVTNLLLTNTPNNNKKKNTTLLRSNKMKMNYQKGRLTKMGWMKKIKLKNNNLIKLNIMASQKKKMKILNCAKPVNYQKKKFTKKLIIKKFQFNIV